MEILHTAVSPLSEMSVEQRRVRRVRRAHPIRWGRGWAWPWPQWQTWRRVECASIDPRKTSRSTWPPGSTELGYAGLGTRSENTNTNLNALTDISEVAMLFQAEPVYFLYLDQALLSLLSVLPITQKLPNITLYEPSEHPVDILTNNVVKFGT